eukprot:CAMPEP_0176361660 /NCGR_PEP_ID=MMETSP0126-20121128/17892_1 /TAXON_ID=141414 ORGANISM="Strombidinopsis acuminatum, Strain SPMC142" /NCGR_SAMPLE_ID=MMETSP0126 /ASSEMBLY_ACC=CAM_ASM_000229 /LENGTH=91 /DNA_ID=CAMNT_0017717283 /DNA_START=636 /DNA_END=911 /DNA_ORIENTATION=+
MVRLFRVTELIDKIILSTNQKAVVKYFRPYHVAKEDASLDKEDKSSDENEDFMIEETPNVQEFNPDTDEIDQLIYSNIFWENYSDKKNQGN